jgi:hypothetical protein
MTFSPKLELITPFAALSYTVSVTVGVDLP